MCPASHNASGGEMASPLPPQSGSSTSARAKLTAIRDPPRWPPRPAATINAIAIQVDTIKFIAKPIMRLSDWPTLRIDKGSTASVNRVQPRSLRARSNIEAADVDSNTTLKYRPVRKSLATYRDRPARMSREIIGRCSLC
jgi:hypothetical protein